MKNILPTLAFFVSYPEWHSYKRACRATKNAVKSLEKRGFLEVNEFGQARYTGKRFN